MSRLRDPPVPSRDFYRVLGVPRDASRGDIRAAFVRLAKHHHPDHAPTAGDLPGRLGRLGEVRQAYRCLSDSAARTAHDHALEEGERLHVARQRRVRRRLDRYDGRRSQPQPDAAPRRGRIRWRALWVVVAGVLVYLAG